MVVFTITGVHQNPSASLTSIQLNEHLTINSPLNPPPLYYIYLYLKFILQKLSVHKGHKILRGNLFKSHTTKRPVYKKANRIIIFLLWGRLGYQMGAERGG